MECILIWAAETFFFLRSFRNIFYTEDRDMWNRLAWKMLTSPSSMLILFNVFHVNIQKVLSITYTWKIMCNDFTGGTSLKQYLRYEYQKRHKFSMRLRLYRALIMMPCYLMTRLALHCLGKVRIFLTGILEYREKNWVHIHK